MGRWSEIRNHPCAKFVVLGKCVSQFHDIAKELVEFAR